MGSDPLSSIKEQVRREGLELGFARVGFAPVAPLPHARFLQRWIEQGMAAGMTYMARDSVQRSQPTSLLSSARTAIVTVSTYAMAMTMPRPTPPNEAVGRVARYAWGQDYHQVIRVRLERLAESLSRLTGSPVATQIAVDTSPLMERELAMAAGVGFIGKNTMLITPGLGSFTVLGTLLVDLELQPDRPTRPRCGRCNLCLEACPTGALKEPFLLDARRCISYLTIEHRGHIDDQLRDKIHPWLFGCDRCQEACPYNAKAGDRRGEPDHELNPDEGVRALPLADLLDLRSGAYRRLVRGRALGRASRATLIRNAALVAGGQPSLSGSPRLLASLSSLTEEAEPRPVIQEAARWALSRLGGSAVLKRSESC